LRGVSHDNGEVARVDVNGSPARIVANAAGVADWEAEFPLPSTGRVTARAADVAGNVEATAHEVVIPSAGEERRF
jgi:hypothetical protein